MIFEMVLWLWNGFKGTGDVLSSCEGYGMCSMLIHTIYDVISVSSSRIWFIKNINLLTSQDGAKCWRPERRGGWWSWMVGECQFGICTSISILISKKLISGHKQIRTTLPRIGNLISNSPFSPSQPRRWRRRPLPSLFLSISFDFFLWKIFRFLQLTMSCRWNKKNISNFYLFLW